MTEKAAVTEAVESMTNEKAVTYAGECQLAPPPAKTVAFASVILQ